MLAIGCTIILKCHLYDILNVRAQTEDKSNDRKDIFHEEV
jgi:hypothetical protein